MLLTTLTTGCLITDPIDIPEEENFPPSIVSDNTGEHPIEEVVLLELFDPDVTSLKFDVKVRDPNVEQDLEFQVWVDHVEGDFSGLVEVSETPIIQHTGEVERAFSFTIDNLNLFRDPPNECHTVELRVSSDFKNFLPVIREPETDGDLDVAVWFVDARVDEITRPTLEQCP